MEIQTWSISDCSHYLSWLKLLLEADHRLPDHVSKLWFLLCYMCCWQCWVNVNHESSVSHADMGKKTSINLNALIFKAHSLPTSCFPTGWLTVVVVLASPAFPPVVDLDSCWHWSAAVQTEWWETHRRGSWIYCTVIYHRDHSNWKLQRSTL